MPTIAAFVHVTAQSCRPAVCDGSQDSSLMACDATPVRGSEVPRMSAHDVGHLQAARTHFRTLSAIAGKPVERACRTESCVLRDVRV